MCRHWTTTPESHTWIVSFFCFCILIILRSRYDMTKRQSIICYLYQDKSKRNKIVGLSPNSNECVCVRLCDRNQNEKKKEIKEKFSIKINWINCHKDLTDQMNIGLIAKRYIVCVQFFKSKLRSVSNFSFFPFFCLFLVGRFRFFFFGYPSIRTKRETGRRATNSVHVLNFTVLYFHPWALKLQYVCILYIGLVCFT